MLTLLGRSRATCDGHSRREVLRAGALALFGSVLPQPAGASARATAPAKSVILIDLYGGPSHIDMFDMKPAAPREVRGEFDPIATSLTGLRICEHLPRLAKWMHKTTLIRSVTHGYNSHNPYAVMTGFTGGNDQQDYFARPSNHPSMGSVCQYLGVGQTPGVPGYVLLPAYPGYSEGLRRAGPYGGYLGNAYNPLFTTCDPDFGGRKVTRGDLKDFYDPTIMPIGDPLLPIPKEITLDTLDRRRKLLDQLDRVASRSEIAGPEQVMQKRQRQALELLLSPKSRQAFDLDREPARVRDRYGRDVFGSSALLARRLVEAGVTFTTIHTESLGNGHWDTHANNFNLLKGFLLPWFDRSLTALLDDLETRGLLETTLVVVTGDMGRTPRVNKSAGRDHWPQCGFCLLAGGGTRKGLVYGASDGQAAYVRDFPVTPGDLCATIYHQIGIDPDTMVPDQNGRPLHITHGGSVVRGVLA